MKSIISGAVTSSATHHYYFPCSLLRPVVSPRHPFLSDTPVFRGRLKLADRVGDTSRLPVIPSATTAGLNNFTPPNEGNFTVGDFMMKKEDLHVVETTTTVEKALETLVEKRITGFPVIDADWNLVGVVSDYDLLALDSISGSNGLFETPIAYPRRVSMQPKTYNRNSAHIFQLEKVYA